MRRNGDRDNLVFPGELETTPIVGVERPVGPEDEVARLRIKHLLETANPWEIEHGMHWYEEVNGALVGWVEKYRMKSVAQAAGIVAALSPNLDWATNYRRAEQLVRTGRAAGLHHTIDTATRILQGEDPNTVLNEDWRNNPKVRAFFHNLAYPLTSQLVTVDRHMIGLLYDDPSVVRDKMNGYISAQQHMWAGALVTQYARDLGVLPHQVQSTTWVVWRRKIGQAYVHEGKQLDFTVE